MHTDGEAAVKMLNHFYVDNLVTGVTTVTEAIKFYAEAKKIMSNIGMNLREWVSNCVEFNKSIPQADRATGSIIKVLGIPWNVSEDLLHVKGIPTLCGVETPPTKRQILQTIAKLFDPLGLVSPVVIKAKIFLQELWKVGIPWDAVPADELLETWKDLNSQLSELDSVKVPRHLNVTDNCELHVFVDASSKAYAAVAYVRYPVGSSKDEYKSNLVCSKSKVAPIKAVTTPGLELMAALIGCQLAAVIQKSYFFSSVQLWSDSEIVLHWISNPTNKQGVFVCNRIKSVIDYGFSFRYVPTKKNPADLPSRGVNTSSLMSSIWWKGPKSLAQTEDNWPNDTIKRLNRILLHLQTSGDTICHVTDGSQNPVNDSDTIVTSLVTKSYIRSPQPPFGIDFERFSSLFKLLRVTAVCSQFVKRLLKRPNSSGPITAEEYSSTRNSWIQFVQQQHFGVQFHLLKKTKSDSTIRSMRLVLDGGFIKCQGRFDNSDLSADTNCPIILPKRNKFIDLVILDQHFKLYHQGVRHTLSALRQSYWITSGRQQVRFVIQKCLVCRLWEGGSYSNPSMPPLPSMRVTKSPAFSFTGCDFAGPLTAFHGTSSSKVYICLFTCAVTRAIHLELVEDLTTNSFLLALRRFISRRGCPMEIISDNAKTFKLAKQVLDKLWHDIVIATDTVNYVAHLSIKWKFNVERAPWWGGFFEKMVGLTKRTLVKAAGKSKLSAVELSTLLAEVEAVLNSRPLTYVYDDLVNGTPLCPANFLSESNYFAVPHAFVDSDSEYKDPNSSTTTLVIKLRIKQQVLERFWIMWLKDYLTSLRELHHQRHKTSRHNNYVPHIGDIVLSRKI